MICHTGLLANCTFFQQHPTSIITSSSGINNMLTQIQGNYYIELPKRQQLGLAAACND